MAENCDKNANIQVEIFFNIKEEANKSENS